MSDEKMARVEGPARVEYRFLSGDRRWCVYLGNYQLEDWFYEKHANTRAEQINRALAPIVNILRGGCPHGCTDGNCPFDRKVKQALEDRP